MSSRYVRSSRRRELVIFGGSTHPSLTRSIARKVGVRTGEIRINRFANREIRVEILENVRGRDTFVIQTGGSLTPNDDLMELLLLISSLKTSSAANVTVILPFYPYSKGDQRDSSRVSIPSKLVADLIRRAGAEHIMILDPHSPQLEGFFNMPADMLKVESLFCDWIRKTIPSWESCMIVSPDEGAVKRSVAMANFLRLDFALIHDRNRDQLKLEQDVATFSLNSDDDDDDPPEIKEGARISGVVRDRRVVLLDDMIDTGNTVEHALEVLQREGAYEVYVLATHGIFSNTSLPKMQAWMHNGFVRAVVVTNTIPQEKNKGKFEKLRVIDVAGLIAEFVRRHHYCESVSVLSNFAPTEDEPPHRHLKLIPPDHRRKKISEARSEESDRRGKKTSEAKSEDSEPEGAGPLPADPPNVKGAIGRLRKGFRLSSVCWDEPGEQ